jgi:4-hydroxybenzoate polyprenyltransferase
MKAIGILRLLRFHQWLKNLMLFFPPLLSGALLQPHMIQRGIVPFISFSLAASASYVFNDLCDLKSDREHPEKRLRPLPNGDVSKSLAIAMIVLLLAGSVFLGGKVSSRFLSFVCIYLLFTALYSLTLKDWPIIDIFCISLGFILRLYAGGEAFGVFISDWLFLTVFLLSLFLSLGKRHSEQMSLGMHAGKHRRTLEVYPDGFLENAMYLCGGAVVVTYSVFVLTKPFMVYTVPLCVFGLFRYLFRVKSGQSGDPTRAMLLDMPLMFISLLWLIMVFWSIYQ